MFNKLFLYILILYQCIRTITPNYRDIPLILTEDGQILAKVSIGDPPQLVLLKLLTASNQLMVQGGKNNSGYEPNKSDTVYHSTTFKKVIYKGSELTIQMLQDDFNLSQYKAERIIFNYIVEGEFTLDCDGLIGLGFNDDSNSDMKLIENIKELKLKIFSIQIKSKTGFLVLGDFKHLIQDNNRKLYSFCPLITEQNKHSYNCFIDSVYLSMSNKVIFQKIKSKIAFNMETNAIIVSKVFFDDLTHNIYNELIEEDICSINESRSIKYISCRGNQKKRVEGKLNFIVGKWSLAIDLLHDWDKGFKISKFICDTSNPDQWVFGTPLLSKYTVIFNKENSQIGFIKH